MTIYQPQVDGLQKNVLSYRAAVSFKATGSDEPVFGAAWFESTVEIDREERMVHIVSLDVIDTRFPEGSANVRAEFEQAVKTGLPNWQVDFSLDDLLTSLEAAEEEIAAANNLNMDPPEIIYRNHPALLIMVDGDPVMREIENSPYDAVINTPYPLIFDPKKGTYYLNAGKDVWYQAGKATGPSPSPRRRPPARPPSGPRAGEGGGGPGRSGGNVDADGLALPGAGALASLSALTAIFVAATPASGPPGDDEAIRRRSRMETGLGLVVFTA